MRQKIINIGHRGAASLRPENTMASFEKAWQVGAHGVETDVQVSADGQLLLCHDRVLTRTTDVASRFPGQRDRPLHLFSWEELSQLDAGSWFVEADPFGTIARGLVPQQELDSLRRLRIPLLAELLDLVGQRSWFVNLELKRQPAEVDQRAFIEATLAAVAAAGLEPAQFAISSFEHSYLRLVAEHWPEVELNALIGGNRPAGNRWGDYAFAIYNANAELFDTRQLAEARRHGCRVNLYTVNEPAAMHFFLSAGVERIITDFPQLLSAAMP